MKEEIGIINEQGDLGINYDPLTDKEQESIQEEYDKHIKEKKYQQGE